MRALRPRWIALRGIGRPNAACRPLCDNQTLITPVATCTRAAEGGNDQSTASEEVSRPSARRARETHRNPSIGFDGHDHGAKQHDAHPQRSLRSSCVPVNMAFAPPLIDRCRCIPRPRFRLLTPSVHRFGTPLIRSPYVPQRGQVKQSGASRRSIIGMIRHELLTNLRQMPGYLV
jgi:hypothetical protein